LKSGDTEPELSKEQDSLTAGDDGADSGGIKEKTVESSSKTSAGHNPNKVQAPEKPKPKQSSAGEPSPFGNNIAEFIQFLSDTWQEFRKISWPNREQVIRETWSVLVLCALITCSVLAFDWAIAKSIFEPLDRYAKKMGGGVGHTTQTWGPLTPRPGAPVDNPNIPGNALPPAGAPPTTAPSPQPTAPAPESPAPVNGTPDTTPKP
jgi:preprotein translocase SecE subunit